MDFTPKQKIVAGVIAGVLVFGVFASTVASVVISLTSTDAVYSDSEVDSAKVGDRRDTGTAESVEEVNSSGSTDSITADSKQRQVEFDEGFSEAIKDSEAKLNIQRESRPVDVVEPRPSVSAESRAGSDDNCSEALRASIDGYREGLVKLEYDRRDREKRGELSDRDISVSSDNESSADVDKPNPVDFHNKRLESIEQAYQRQLSMNNCI